jgi:membrane protease YdiL (CAAX protease family)
MTIQTTRRSFMGHIFLSPTEKRLRAGWRLLLQTAFMVIIAIGASILIYIIPGINRYDPDGSLRNALVETLMITGSIFLACMWLDKRPFTYLGFNLSRRMIPDLLVGILIPFVLIGFIFIVELSAGWLTFSGFSSRGNSASQLLSGLIISFIAFIIVGWNEELLSRGYHLQTLASGMNLFWGVLISSSIFGILHLANPNSENKVMVALGILAAGVFLAYGYLRTGQLWLSIGLHIGWNFFEGPVFSFPVSGTGSFHLINVTISGPQLWTGGGFGPEAGLIVFPILALGMLLTFLYTRGRQPVKKPVDQANEGSPDEHGNII